ncbi:MAG: sulfite oxidase heme-binding subunit YedZ [Gemmatimonadales bacterium]
MIPRHIRRAAKPAVLLMCLVPLGLIVADALLGRLPAEPIKNITHRTGVWGLTFLTITLAVTPLRRITGWNALAGYRRMLGLVAFTYLTTHFLIYLVLDQFFAWPYIIEDIAERPYITVGFTGFVLLIPLALTSTAAAIRRLGKKWVRLHSLIYVTALAGVVHFMWSQKADVRRPTIYGLVLIGLLAMRLIPRRHRMRRTDAPVGQADAQAQQTHNREQVAGLR